MKLANVLFPLIVLFFLASCGGGSTTGNTKDDEIIGSTSETSGDTTNNDNSDDSTTGNNTNTTTTNEKIELAYIDLPIKSHFAGEAHNAVLNGKYYYETSQYTLDLYDITTSDFIKTIITTRFICDLEVDENNVFLVSRYFDTNDKAIFTLNRFSNDNIGDYQNTPSIELKSAKIIYFGDGLISNIINSGDSSTIVNIKFDGTAFTEISRLEIPFAVYKFIPYGDKIIAMPGDYIFNDHSLIVVDQANPSSNYKLYSEYVEDFDIIANRYLIVALGNVSTLDVRDLSTEGYPILLEQNVTYPEKLTVNDNYLAVVTDAENDELVLIDFTDIDNPKGSTFDLSGPLYSYKLSWSSTIFDKVLRWQGDHLLINNADEGVALVDTPSENRLVPTVKKFIPHRFWIGSLDFTNPTEIVFNSNHAVERWTIEDANHPQRIEYGNPINNPGKTIYYKGNYFIISLHDLETWQVGGDFFIQKDSLNLTEKSSSGAALKDLKIYNDVAYVLSNGLLNIVDISLPSSLKLLGSLHIENIDSFLVKGDYLLANRNYMGLDVYNLADKNNPQFVKTYDLFFYSHILDGGLITDSHIYTDTYKSYNITALPEINLDMNSTVNLGYTFNSGVVDVKNNLLVYLRKSYNSQSEIFMFDINDNEPKYLKTAILPLDADEIYLSDSALIAKSYNYGDIFLFAWPPDFGSTK